MDGNVTLLSLNCRGLKKQIKRNKAFKYLKEKKCNIYCLQDVHFTKEMKDDLKEEWEGEIFYAPFRSNARGVCILFNNNFEYKVTKEEKDEYGNYLIIDFQESVDNETFTLINIYGPNKDNPYFYDVINHYLTKTNSDVKVVCGDFNLVQDFSLDRKGCMDYNPKAKSKVFEIKNKHELVDPFREKYPQKKGFTWKENFGSKKARLDFFLVSQTLFPQVDSVAIVDTSFSDHSAIILKFNLKFFQKTTFVPFQLPECQGLYRMQIKHNEKWILTQKCDCQILHLLHSKRKLKLHGRIFDMSLKILGALLVTDVKHRKIKQISLSSGQFQITTFFQDSTKKFFGIHVAHNGDVLVGSFDTKDKKSSIIRLSSEGKLLDTINARSKCRFFRITENVNDDILILISKKLLVFNTEGTFRFIYSRPKTINIIFKPSDVVCSVSGQIIIADTGSKKCIHLLDKDGKFIQFLLRENNDLEYPRELALSDSGILSIGYSNGKIANSNRNIDFSRSSPSEVVHEN